jgi:hypothetical protein
MSANPTFEPTEVARAQDALDPLRGTGPVFLVGCAGSGTSILARVLDAHPGVTSVEEPGGPWSTLPSGAGGSDRLTAEHATAEVKESLRRWAAEQQGGSTLLLAHDPRNSLRAPFLRAVFPEARFVHVVRDGRDVARALMVDLGGDQWAALRPAGWRELLDGASGYLRCALAWREVVETTLADLDGVGHVLVRFEDLMERSEETAERVYRALGLTDDARSREAFAQAPAIARELPNAQRYTVRRWRAVAVERPFELRAANLLIRDLLETLDYDAAPPELAQASEAQLPRSVLFELRRLERMVEEREGRIAKLEQKLADLEHSHRVEKRAAEHARAALARAEQHASAEAQSSADRRGALEARVAELEAARRTARELAEALRAGQRETERRLELAELARAELVEERRRLETSLDAAAEAMKRTSASRAWRLGHRLARFGAVLMLRRPGRDSALDSALDDIDRARRGPGV